MRAYKHWISKPVFVYLIGILFILAPLGFTAATMISNGISNWYNPIQLWIYAKDLGTADQLCLGLILFAGLNLLRIRKFSWLLAIATLLFVGFFNLYQRVASEGLRGLFSPWMLISFFSTVFFSILLYLFRYPYVEERDGFLYLHPRVATQIPIQLASLDHGNATTTGQIVNLSRAGALIHFTVPQRLSFLKKGESISIQVLGQETGTFHPNSTLTGKVLRIDGNGFAISFTHLSREMDELIRRLMESSV